MVCSTLLLNTTLSNKELKNTFKISNKTLKKTNKSLKSIFDTRGNFYSSIFFDGEILDVNNIRGNSSSEKLTIKRFKTSKESDIPGTINDAIISKYYNSSLNSINYEKSGKNVDQIDKKTGSIIASYTSMHEASKKLNINYTGISQVYNYHKYDDATRPACYKLKSTNGFIFKDSE